MLKNITKILLILFMLIINVNLNTVYAQENNGNNLRTSTLIHRQSNIMDIDEDGTEETNNITSTNTGILKSVNSNGTSINTVKWNISFSGSNIHLNFTILNYLPVPLGFVGTATVVNANGNTFSSQYFSYTNQVSLPIPSGGGSFSVHGNYIVGNPLFQNMNISIAYAW